MKKRGSGILLAVSSLASPHGIGDMGRAAYDLVDFLAGTGQSYWQILPLNPTDEENGNSPYFSSSALAGSPLLISLQLLSEEGLLSAEDIGPVPEFDPEVTDYAAVEAFKMKALDKAFEKFEKLSGKQPFMDFCSENAYWLDDYALFMAIKEEFSGKAWGDWPEELKAREVSALEAAGKKHAVKIKKEKFLQYVFNAQWSALREYCAGKGITIIGDLPIYVSYDSADVWVNPEIFKLDEHKKPYVVSGVPPDYFSATGQLWNNPVYRWDVLKAKGYDWWVKRFAMTFRRFDIVRIDHFRGLVQYWEIPASEKTAINGSWQDVPTYDFFDTMKRHFPDFRVIAEDLGVITDDVREAKRHYGFPGMKVLQFAFGGDFPDGAYLPHNYERNSIVYPGTHDNTTMVGWFTREATEDEKKRLFRYLYREVTEKDIAWEMIRLAMMSVADTAIIPMQDILELDGKARMNQPALSTGNWRWRLKGGLLGESHAKKLRELTATYGRARKKRGDS